MGAERELLLLMTNDSKFIDKVGEHLSPEDFTDLSYGAVFESLLADPNPEHDHASRRLAPGVAKVFEGLVSDSKDRKELRQPERVFEESLGRILGSVMQEELDGMDRLIENTTDEDRRSDLLARKARLGSERRELSIDWSAAARKTLERDH